LLAVLSSARAFAQDPEPATDPQLARLHDKVTPFLKAVSEGEAQAAFEELLTGSQLAKQTESVKALVEKSQEVQKRYGKFRASEQIAAKRIGKDLMLLRYLYKCDNYPVVWYFTYYRDLSHADMPAEDDNWLVISVRFDTQLDLLGM